MGGPASRPHPPPTEATPTAATQCPPPCSLLPDSVSARPDAPLRKMAADSEVSSTPWVHLSQSSAAEVSGPRLTVCALLCPRSPSPKCLRSQTSPQPRSGKGEWCVWSCLAPGSIAQVTLVLRETPTSLRLFFSTLAALAVSASVIQTGQTNLQTPPLEQVVLTSRSLP